MNRGRTLLAVVLFLLILVASATPAQAGHCYPVVYHPVCYPIYHCPPVYCPPVYCPPVCCYPCYPCYPCGTITAGSIAVIIDGPPGLTDIQVTIDNKAAKQQTTYPIFVSAEPIDVNKEVDFKVTAKLGTEAYGKIGKAKGYTNERVILEKGVK